MNPAAFSFRQRGDKSLLTPFTVGTLQLTYPLALPSASQGTNHDSPTIRGSCSSFARLRCEYRQRGGLVRWRGPTGQGQTDDKKLPLTWNIKTGENVIWKVELPLQGKADAMSGVDQISPAPSFTAGVFVTVSHWPAKIDPKQHPEHHVAC